MKPQRDKGTKLQRHKDTKGEKGKGMSRTEDAEGTEWGEGRSVDRMTGWERERRRIFPAKAGKSGRRWSDGERGWERLNLET